MSRFHANRRRFLTAVGATALSLPFLRPLPTYAGPNDKRYMILLFTPNGVLRHLWGADPTAGPFPSGAGATSDFKLRPWLSKFEPIKDKMIVLRGLSNKSAGVGDPHGPGMATLWTGTDASGQQPAAAPSIDQAIADAIKPDTQFPTLEFRAKSPQDYEGKSIYNRMSYSLTGQPVDPREDALAARDQLFLGLGGMNPDPMVNTKLEVRKRVLSHLDGELGRLTPKLCNEDKAHLEALQDGFARMSKNLGGGGGQQSAGCKYPDNIVGDKAFPKVTRDHIELLVMSIACDLTRIASLQFSQALSPMVPDWLNIGLDHHNISHQAPQRHELGPEAPVKSDADHPTQQQTDAKAGPIADLTKIYDFYAGEILYLCQRLAQFPSANGKTLLDECVIVWGNELDNGSAHDHWELPFVLIGGANGKLKTNQLVQYPVYNGYSMPPEDKYNAKRGHNDLHVTLAQIMGATGITKFGRPEYNVGPLSEILL